MGYPEHCCETQLRKGRVRSIINHGLLRALSAHLGLSPTVVLKPQEKRTTYARSMITRRVERKNQHERETTIDHMIIDSIIAVAVDLLASCSGLDRRNI